MEYVVTKSTSLFKITSASFLVAGTAIGAGMLGIPLLTAQSGIVPALFITGLVWIFMLATGFLILEAALWMPPGSNILTMAGSLLGKKGRFCAGVLFLFLYLCLMTAYLAGGAPLFLSLMHLSFPQWMGTLLFAVLFGFVAFRGIESTALVNFLLSCGMVVTYIGMIGFGSEEVNASRFTVSNFSAGFFAAPVLFSAFGYHNVVPSLCSYLNRDRRALRLSLWIGTLLALIVYSIWQWMVIGSVPLEALAQAKASGLPATALLVNSFWLRSFASVFAFLALITSLLGVSLSLIDFMKDGFAFCKKSRLIPTLLTFGIPLLIVFYDPTLFDRALGVAGGFGEAFLNGLFPVLLVWAGRYKLRLKHEPMLPGGKALLLLLGCIAWGVFLLEFVSLSR